MPAKFWIVNFIIYGTLIGVTAMGIVLFTKILILSVQNSFPEEK